ncbi:MAG: DUF4268 domain-containing protein [Sphingomonas sp.]
MYRIDRKNNSIHALDKMSFAQLGFRERSHLQEWIAREPSVLGEDLLILQKEFAGFSDTNERLDLLALDKQGSLVIIENKLDDTGRDVTWQALKYASYCSSLSNDDIVKIHQDYIAKSDGHASAQENICSFLEIDSLSDKVLNKGVTQRIIFVAANFRKEVTSAVLWLMSYRLRIQCFVATPYTMDDNVFLSVVQIIPTKDSEDYTISLAVKAHDEIDSIENEARRHPIRRKFWVELINKYNTKSNLYKNISAGKQSWISAGTGVRGIGLNFVATGEYCRSELYIDVGEKTENDRIFSALKNEISPLESECRFPLNWDCIESRRGSRIAIQKVANVFDIDQWTEMHSFMIDAMLELERIVQPRLLAISGRK